MDTDESGHDSWERWRLAGEFRLSAPDRPAGRRRSQGIHGEMAGVKLISLKTSRNLKRPKIICYLFAAA
jgi:hypothetical protein